MSNSKDVEESEKKLIDTSFTSSSSSVLNYNETVEKNDAAQLFKNRFLVVKNPNLGNELANNNNKSNNNTQPATSTIKSSIGEWNFDNYSLDSFNDKSSFNRINEDKFNEKEEINNEDEEEEDVFSETIPMKQFSNDQGFREIEGQDTITSLNKNSAFLKQLEKIKKRSSLKRNSSLRVIRDEGSKSISEFNDVNKRNSVDSQSNLDQTVQPTIQQNQLNHSILNLIFNKQGSIKTKFSSNLSLASDYKAKSILDLSLMNSKLKLNDVTSVKSKRLSIRGSVISIPKETQHEQVMLAIEEVINNKPGEINELFEQVIAAVKLEKLYQKQKRDKARRFCFLIEILVILFLVLMTIFFVFNVINQFKLIHYSKNIQPQGFNNTKPGFVLFGDLFIKRNNSIV